MADEAERGRYLYDWLETEAWPKLVEQGRTDLVTGSLGPSSARSYSEHLDRAERLLAANKKAARLALGDVSMVSSGTSTASGSTALSFYVTVGDTAKKANLQFPNLDRHRVQARIDERLRDLGASDLIAKRQGAWKALQRGASDASSQACHSMREILTELLDHFAPPEDVQRAPWWRRDPEATDGVTKRQKVRFFVAGPSEAAIDDDELDRQVDRAYQAHKEAVAIAHGKDPGRQAARVAVIALEDAIGALLDQREYYSYQRSLRPDGPG